MTRPRPGARQARIGRERARARMIAFLVTLPLYLAAGAMLVIAPFALAAFFADGAPTPAVVIGLTAIAAPLALVVLLIARWSGRFVVSRLTPPRVSAMWLRRFQSESGKGFRISRVVDQLGRFGISALTLQDRDVRLSLEQRKNRLAPVFWLLLLPALGVFAVFYSGFAELVLEALGVDALRSARPGPGESPAAALAGAIATPVAAVMVAFTALILMIAGAVVFFWLAVIFATLLTILAGPFGAVLGRGRDDYKRLPRLLRRYRKDKGPRGATIVRISDAHWQDAVRQGLAAVDVVIIDVTDVTEHIAWEITQAVEARGKAIVFLIRDGSVAQPLADRAVHRALGSEAASSFDVISYPGRRGSGHDRRVFGKALREAVYRAADRSLS